MDIDKLLLLSTLDGFSSVQALMTLPEPGTKSQNLLPRLNISNYTIWDLED